MAHGHAMHAVRESLALIHLHVGLMNRMAG